MQKTLILIPSRLSASRLPNKPLLKINGRSIISQVVKRAKESKLGKVYVATEDIEILKEVKKNGGQAIITSNKHKTGTDRIFECLTKLKNKNLDYVINLQGDEPNIDINDLKNLYKFTKKNNSDIGTLATEIKNNSIYKNKNIVKVITNFEINNHNFPYAKDFKRITNLKRGMSVEDKAIAERLERLQKDRKASMDIPTEAEMEERLIRLKDRGAGIPSQEKKEESYKS